MPTTDYTCDWPPLCPHKFAAQDELDAHSREHWAKEDKLTAWQRDETVNRVLFGRFDAERP